MKIALWIAFALLALLHDWRAVSDWVSPALTSRHSRDIGDDMFVHAALTAGAEILISGDRDLLDLGAVAGLAIVTPAKSLPRVEAWGRG